MEEQQLNEAAKAILTEYGVRLSTPEYESRIIKSMIELLNRQSSKQVSMEINEAAKATDFYKDNSHSSIIQKAIVTAFGLGANWKPKTNGWVSVGSQENPKDYEQVLLLLESGDIIQGQYCDDTDFCFTSPYLKKGQKITHWQRIVLPIKS
jgi:hypothetical protein